MNKIILKLYIWDGFERSQEAEAELLTLVNDIPSELIEYEIVDLHKTPDRAEEDKILATPTLVKLNPPPIRKVIGSFGNKGKVLKELQIDKYYKGDS